MKESVVRTDESREEEEEGGSQGGRTCLTKSPTRDEGFLCWLVKTKNETKK